MKIIPYLNNFYKLQLIYISMLIFVQLSFTSYHSSQYKVLYKCKIIKKSMLGSYAGIHMLVCRVRAS